MKCHLAVRSRLLIITSAIRLDKSHYRKDARWRLMNDLRRPSSSPSHCAHPSTSARRSHSYLNLLILSSCPSAAFHSPTSTTLVRCANTYDRHPQCAHTKGSLPCRPYGPDDATPLPLSHPILTLSGARRSVLTCSSPPLSLWRPRRPSSLVTGAPKASSLPLPPPPYAPTSAPSRTPSLY